MSDFEFLIMHIHSISHSVNCYSVRNQRSNYQLNNTYVRIARLIICYSILSASGFHLLFIYSFVYSRVSYTKSKTKENQLRMYCRQSGHKHGVSSKWDHMINNWSFSRFQQPQLKYIYILINLLCTINFLWHFFKYNNWK